MFRRPSQVETSAGSISVSMAEGGGVRKGLGWGEEGVAQMTRRHGGARVREHERLALGNCQVHFFFFFPKAVQNFSILFLLLFLEMKSQAEMTQGPASCFSPTWCLSR